MTTKPTHFNSVESGAINSNPTPANVEDSNRLINKPSLGEFSSSNTIIYKVTEKETPFLPFASQKEKSA
jgi:hypothetical protein